MKTIDLRNFSPGPKFLSRHMPAIIVAFAIVVLFAADGISQWRNIANSAMSPAVPTPALPYYVMSTPVPPPPAPTIAPPTPDQALRQEVEQLRARVAELEARPAPEPPPPPAPEPVVIIQQAPAAAPTVPQPTEEPPPPPQPSLQQQAILDRQAWAVSVQNDESLSPALMREAQDK